MIEDYLIQYGVLGLWTASLLGERFIFQRGLTKSITDLTETINKKL